MFYSTGNEKKGWREKCLTSEIRNLNTGVVIGLIFKENYKYVAAFGTVYVNALQAFVDSKFHFGRAQSIYKRKISMHF